MAPYHEQGKHTFEVGKKPRTNLLGQRPKRLVALNNTAVLSSRKGRYTPGLRVKGDQSGDTMGLEPTLKFLLSAWQCTKRARQQGGTGTCNPLVSAARKCSAPAL